MKILGLGLSKNLRELYKSELFLISYLFLLSISLLSIAGNIHVGIYIMFILLGFGWSVFFLGERLNLLEHFFTSPIFFLITFLPISIIFAFLDIPLKEWVYIFYAAISLFVFIYVKVFKKEVLFTKISYYDYLILVTFFLACFAKIYSVKDLLVPGLHDPITHVYLSAQILREGVINFFYSPGLHIISAFGKMFNGFDLPKQIIFVTNFFNAYGGLIAYILIKRIFKDINGALLSSLLFSFGYYPTVFFVNAGKNALVFAIPLVLFSVYLLNENRLKKDFKIFFLSNLLLFTTFIVHYPSAVFVCALLLSFFIVYFKEAKWRYLFLGFGIVLGFLWMFKAYTSQVTSPSLISVEESPLFVLPESLFLSIKAFITEVYIWIKSANNRLYYIVSYSSVFGLIVLVLTLKRNCLKEKTVIMVWFLISILIAVGISIFQISDLSIILETFKLLIFVYIYIFAVFLFSSIIILFSKLMRKKYTQSLFILFFVLVTPYLTIKIFQTYKEGSEMHNVVKESDTEAFQWIDKNLSDSQRFIINSNGDNGLVFSTDGGGWLEIYTQNEISTPFYEYSSVQTDKYADLYRELKIDNNNCSVIKDFLDDGYNYYYQGSSPVFDTQLASEEELDNNNQFEKVYNRNSVAIYKLVPCK
jgi:hypothetical protein